MWKIQNSQNRPNGFMQNVSGYTSLSQEKILNTLSTQRFTRALAFSTTLSKSGLSHNRKLKLEIT